MTGQHVRDEDAGHPAADHRDGEGDQAGARVFIGRGVHYVSYGTPGGEFTSQCRAATVTEIDPERGGLVGLCVTNPTGLFFHSLADGGCDHSTSHRGGTWHWPEHK